LSKPEKEEKFVMKNPRISFEMKIQKLNANEVYVF
jgi:hypothetical protein